MCYFHYKIVITNTIYGRSLAHNTMGDQVDPALLEALRRHGIESTAQNTRTIALARALQETVPVPKVMLRRAEKTEEVCFLEAALYSVTTARPMIEEMMQQLEEKSPALHLNVTLRARQLLTGKPISELIQSLALPQLLSVLEVL